ncbi:MAG: hypothetical protein ACLVAT_00985 [Lachnospiraceae bacterium]
MEIMILLWNCWKEECKVKDQRPVERDGFYKIFVGDRKYAVKINERDPEGELTISREYGVYYRIEQGEDGYELYTNRGKIYPEEEKMDPEAVPVRTVAVIPEVLPDMPEDPVRAASTEMPEDPVPTVSRDIPVAQVP